jgi:excisionase family DNA binding protein
LPLTTLNVYLTVRVCDTLQIQMSTSTDTIIRNGDQLLTVADISRLLGVGRPLVHRWIVTGRLAALDLSTGDGRPYYKVLRHQLDAFLAQRETESAEARAGAEAAQ